IAHCSRIDRGRPHRIFKTREMTMTRTSSLTTVCATACLVLMLAPASAQEKPSLPDTSKTPGVALETVPDDGHAAPCLSNLMGKNIKAGDTITLGMICTDHYTTCIRDVSDEEKQAVYQRYGLSAPHTGYCDSKQGCEVDHLISLEIGGSND